MSESDGRGRQSRDRDREMGVLRSGRAASRWYEYVSNWYEPLVADVFWPERLQRKILARLDVGGRDRVLDVGCGTGLTSQYLGERAGCIDAIDLSDDQLQQAADSDEIRFVRGDAHHLPYAPDTFDAVVSVGAILYFSAPATALAEARRVTKPGGELLVAGFNRPSVPSSVPIENWAHAVTAPLFFTYDREDARQLFTEAGWDQVESELTGPVWHPRLALVTTAKATG
ncbi:class I SAM-dependent methyltransferase [Halovenus sp. HT40]|uniref:class I SAM-dependent methyltransferase n=1 Tax=Halovenus sp. HT40 TaxID=3126691 RepID=UPI00300F514C